MDAIWILLTQVYVATGREANTVMSGEISRTSTNLISVYDGTVF